MHKSIILFLALILVSLTGFSANNSDSGWYGRADSGIYTNQCNIVIDTVPTTYSCSQRLSVMCGINGVSYTYGTIRIDSVPLPITFPLYTAPNTTPTGTMTIQRLGNVPLIGVNGPVTAWYRLAGYTGNYGCFKAKN